MRIFTCRSTFLYDHNSYLKGLCLKTDWAFVDELEYIWALVGPREVFRKPILSRFVLFQKVRLNGYVDMYVSFSMQF